MRNTPLPTNQSPWLYFSIFQKHLHSNLSFLTFFFFFHYHAYFIISWACYILIMDIFLAAPSPVLPHTYTLPGPYSLSLVFWFSYISPLLFSSLATFFLYILERIPKPIFHLFLSCHFSGILVFLNACVHTSFLNKKSEFC